jgi:hypothetical protein
MESFRFEGVKVAFCPGQGDTTWREVFQHFDRLFEVVSNLKSWWLTWAPERPLAQLRFSALNQTRPFLRAGARC